MDFLTFKIETSEGSYNEPAELIFPITFTGMNISEFHDKCKRFALALGYHPNTIEKYFGETDTGYLE